MEAVKERPDILLSEKECKQIELQREIQNGTITIYLKNGEPIRVVNIKQSIMF